MKPYRPWLELLQDLYAPPPPEEARPADERFGKLLVDLGLATRAQIDECLALPDAQETPFPSLTALLVQRGVLTPQELEQSLVARAAGDVRALAALLFELLTDRPAPDEGAPAVWPKRLDEELLGILSRALEGRYGDAGPLAADLRRYLLER